MVLLYDYLQWPESTAHCCCTPHATTSAYMVTYFIMHLSACTRKRSKHARNVRKYTYLPTHQHTTFKIMASSGLLCTFTAVAFAALSSATCDKLYFSGDDCVHAPDPGPYGLFRPNFCAVIFAGTTDRVHKASVIVNTSAIARKCLLGIQKDSQWCSWMWSSMFLNIASFDCVTQRRIGLPYPARSSSKKIETRLPG